MTPHDPFAYLERLDDPAVQSFAAQAHAETLSHFARGTDYEALKADITVVLQDENQIPFCQELPRVRRRVLPQRAAAVAGAV